MSSPSAFLLWSILACTFGCFLLIHLWNYDRFQCVRWDAGRQPGAFRRVMTYSYLVSVPLLLIFSVGYTILKFREGFMQNTENIPFFPVPIEYWDKGNRRMVLPLYFVLSEGWGLEIVTHLEELMFWVFMLHQAHRQRNWFECAEFRIWYMGSMVSVLGMPLIVMITRRNLETCLAWLFLAGSIASTLTTISFIYVLYRFPAFLQAVKLGGAEPDVIVRLSTFYQLNLFRVVLRFFFTVPLLVLSVDGLYGSHYINASYFWSDFLLMVAGFGCFASSAITLLVFFPRSFTRESGYTPRDPLRPAHDKNTIAVEQPTLPSTTYARSHIHISQNNLSPSVPPGTPAASHSRLPQHMQYRSNTPTNHSHPSVLHYNQGSSPKSSPHSPSSPGLQQPKPLAALRYEETDHSIESDRDPTPDFRPYDLPSHRPQSRTSESVEETMEGDGPYTPHSPEIYLYPSPEGAGSHAFSRVASVRGHSRKGTAHSGPPGTPLESGSWTPVSQIHPYVLNFTSPIDLCDD